MLKARWNLNHDNAVVLIQTGRTWWKISRLVLRKMTFRLALAAGYVFGLSESREDALFCGGATFSYSLLDNG